MATYHFGFFMLYTDKQQALREANIEPAKNTSGKTSKSAEHKRVSFLAIERGQLINNGNDLSE